ncbi:MAG: MaoC family dehydratase N-terminal domain-containing protein, partial [Deltaproteobacteria bacterium]|nr:MaoC family dehydratase N-terminal domain-containing protein [Deltaproteobacteria bacterium]
MPSNRALIGKEYPAQSHDVTLAEIEQYAAAYDDTNARYRGQAAVAPPMFAVTTALRDGVRQVVMDGELIG